ncbi:transposase family protein [Streptomyces sp. NBC_01478]
MRAPGAGPDHELVFFDRVVVTLVALRFQLPHVALAELYRVDRSTVTRAIREIRPLLAARGFAAAFRAARNCALLKTQTGPCFRGAGNCVTSPHRPAAERQLTATPSPSPTPPAPVSPSRPPRTNAQASDPC